MDGRQPNPFQIRDIPHQPWSFDGMNEAVQATLLQPIAPQDAQNLGSVPARGSAMTGQPSPHRPSTRPGSDRYSWHNPLGRNQENVPPRSSRRNTTQQPSQSRRSRQNADQGANNHHVVPYALGTREEVQSEDYVSPLATMYGRAWNRYREAEERRAANRQLNTDAVDMFGTGPPQLQDPGQQFIESMNNMRRVSEQEFRARMDAIAEAQAALMNPLTEPDVNPIDSQLSRPPPISSEEMTANIECRICHEQKMDTILEPCMHLSICHWCLEVMRARVRRYRIDPENGERRLRCPICRRNVTQARRIYMAL
ncbi:hypothetical protein A1O7_03106 [Cladophialophora yegresii CBS 114405]|uniref:RING-type domain-containing protein n=1 Tax=Cladophialophora yegresii CBS 114405 TaxID=1182544 RepID=W9W3Y5_9EURO|nr:uncharacterized protein A1O7_03106 [Cladophialophora yegresii CBS 114405]EXJ62668.1 hypothetical protein A1O7_03106 [Cladophialophora yegresii CBS 114405]